MIIIKDKIALLFDSPSIRRQNLSNDMIKKRMLKETLPQKAKQGFLLFFYVVMCIHRGFLFYGKLLQNFLQKEKESFPSTNTILNIVLITKLESFDSPSKSPSNEQEF